MYKRLKRLEKFDSQARDKQKNFKKLFIQKLLTKITLRGSFFDKLQGLGYLLVCLGDIPVHLEASLTQRSEEILVVGGEDCLLAISGLCSFLHLFDCFYFYYKIQKCEN